MVPLGALIVLLATWFKHEHPFTLLLIAVFLIGAVLSAVHHAEVVAHRVGEPVGSLVLAVAVTVIEVGLIVMLMTGGGPGASTYARDTVFAAVMITLNGIVGISLLVGALRHRLVSFNASGSGSALATVITLAGVCLVLPGFTVSVDGSGVLHHATGIRGGGFAGPLLRIRVHPDRPAPGLLRAGLLRPTRPRHRPARSRR